MSKFASTIIDIGDTTGVSSVTGGSGSETNESLCPSLSWKNRIIGCVCCMCLGMVLSILSWVCVFLSDFVTFGVLFTLGNICSIASTFFLAGPVRQFKSMFNENRWVATVIYIVAMVLTILAAVLVDSGVLVIVCCLLQFVAMWWYILSYIPFARDAIKSAVAGLFRS